MTVKLFHKGKPVVIENVRSIREYPDRYRLHVNEEKETRYYDKATTNRLRVK